MGRISHTHTLSRGNFEPERALVFLFPILIYLCWIQNRELSFLMAQSDRRRQFFLDPPVAPLKFLGISSLKFLRFSLNSFLLRHELSEPTFYEAEREDGAASAIPNNPFSSKLWAVLGSNQGPLSYQESALPLSQRPTKLSKRVGRARPPPCRSRLQPPKAGKHSITACPVLDVPAITGCKPFCSQE